MKCKIVYGFYRNTQLYLKTLSTHTLYICGVHVIILYKLWHVQKSCTGYNLYVAITCTKCSKKKIITWTKALILHYSFLLDTRGIFPVLLFVYLFTNVPGVLFYVRDMICIFEIEQILGLQTSVNFRFLLSM